MSFLSVRVTGATTTWRETWWVGLPPAHFFRVAINYAPDGQLVIDKSLKEDRVGVREKGQFLLPV